MRGVLLLLLSLCVFCPLNSICFVSAVDCKWVESNSREQFDFSPLSFKQDIGYQGHNGLGGWWSETCTTDECQSCATDGCAVSEKYEYLFNLCAPLYHTPNASWPKCHEPANQVSAYQYKPDGTHCTSIGKAATQKVELLTPGKPSQGIMITYEDSDGSLCSSGEPRKFTLHVRCSSNLPADPQLNYANNNKFQGMQPLRSSPNTLSLATTDNNNNCPFKPDCDIETGDVYENITLKCDYHMNLDTIFGCPSSCLIDNTACSNHGICAEDNEVTRCFCDVGYGGDKCQNSVDTSPASSSSPNTVLSVFVLILLFAALGLGYALYRKIRGFHGDYDHQYGQLSDGAGKQGRGMTINNA